MQRSGGSWVSRALIIAAGVELFILGHAAAPGPVHRAGGTITAGALTLSYDKAWTPRQAGSGPWSSAARLERADGTWAQLAALDSDADPTVAVRRLLGEQLHAVQPVRVGEAPALSFEAAGGRALLFSAQDGTRALLACRGAAEPCVRLAGSARVWDAAQSGPSREVASELRAALGAIATESRAVAPLLKAAPAKRASGARRMAAAYQRLDTTAGTAGLRDLQQGARAVAGEFTTLAAAAVKRDRAAYDRARAAAARDQKALAGLVRDLRWRGFAVEGAA